MFRSLSFRQKIFVSQLFIFLFFILLLIPFAKQAVHQLVQRSLKETSAELIVQLKKQNSERGMVDYLKSQEQFVFFRVSLIDGNKNRVYDTHIIGLESNITPFSHISDSSEVDEALKTGSGYRVGWSDSFQKKFAYMALRFSFEGKQYVLRTAFPSNQIDMLTQNFRISLFTIDILFLVLFSATAWLIFSRLSLPIREIMQAIKPYQEGAEEEIPQIHLKNSFQDDFTQLSLTLNSLTTKIRSHIRSLVDERNEKGAILETLLEGVIAVDKQLIVRYVNSTGCKMLGVVKNELLGHKFPETEDTVRLELFKKCSQFIEEAFTHKVVVTDSLYLGGNLKVYLDLIAVPKPFEGGVVIILQDKTSHYKILEVGKDFVANASHELRTPITIIRGFAETLQDLPQIKPEMLSSIVEKIVRNCQRMETLVKSLLTLSDIENLPLSRFQNGNLGALLENCCHSVLSIYPRADVIIDPLAHEVWIEADCDLLEMAIMNLFNNAAKYSSGDPFIQVKLSIQKNHVGLEISDKGIGIPVDDLSHIFERFYTVNKAHSRSLGGAGLGLSIVKTVIEKHHGTIKATSEVGRGTTFTIQLPLKHAFSNYGGVE